MRIVGHVQVSQSANTEPKLSSYAIAHHGFVSLLTRSVLAYPSLLYSGMGCRALGIFYPRSLSKRTVLLFVFAITTLYITMGIYHLIRRTRFRFSENDIKDFHQQWCKMHRWREDWEGMAKPCDGQVDWEQRQVNSEWRTDARSSFITKWEIQPAGKITLKYLLTKFTTNK